MHGWLVGEGDGVELQQNVHDLFEERCLAGAVCKYRSCLAAVLRSLLEATSSNASVWWGFPKWFQTRVNSEQVSNSSLMMMLGELRVVVQFSVSIKA